MTASLGRVGTSHNCFNPVLLLLLCNVICAVIGLPPYVFSPRARLGCLCFRPLFSLFVPLELTFRSLLALHYLHLLILGKLTLVVFVPFLVPPLPKLHALLVAFLVSFLLNFPGLEPALLQLFSFADPR